jgi:hypothetical protein
LGLGRLGKLHHYGYIKGRSAARTTLSGGHARRLLLVFPFDAGRHSVRTNRAQYVAFGVVDNWGFHTLLLSTTSDVLHDARVVPES